MASSADLEGRTALVTGASGGIGAAVSRRLADAGARVWMVARNADRLETAARDCGGVPVPADLAHADGARTLQAAWARENGAAAPHILVNAAGTFELAAIADTEPEMFERMLDGNLRAPFHAIRAFLPGMLEAGDGLILTIGSVAGRHAFPHNGAYSASKFGARGLHAVLDQELRGSGVRATLLEPAATDTDIWDGIDRDTNPGLPPRDAMLAADAVADAVHYIATRPAKTRIPVFAIERS
ncbi:MAG TPA: SDR family oxidoreductase [Longimicrobiales bacterium]|nr:SDR family oxidoreductase [Longimicrobiales bacterium]